jgi:hypothetical protein
MKSESVEEPEEISMIQRPRRTSSVKSIPDVEIPMVPQRPVRKSSVKSFKSQHSIEESHIPEPAETVPNIPERPERAVSKEVEFPHHDEPTEESETEYTPAKIAPPIEQIPTSTHQHPAIPARPTNDDQPTEIHILPERPKNHETPESVTADDAPSTSIPAIPARPEKHHVVESIPSIPPRPQTSPASEQQTLGLAALPVIPARPSKPTKHTDLPTVAMDSTPEIIATEGGLFESIEEPISSYRKHVDAETLLTQIPDTTPVPTETIPLEPQTEIAHKLKIKSPPPIIPARPTHKLARQFEPVVKEKPAPPPRPMKGAASSRFAGLRAQFAKDLNEKLAKPPIAPKKVEEEEVHSLEPEVVETGMEGGMEKTMGTVVDVRKGRARGPQRRPPTVKPIVPTGWGISSIATVFEQKEGILMSRENMEESSQPKEIIRTGSGVTEDEVKSKVTGGDIAKEEAEHQVDPLKTAAPAFIPEEEPAIELAEPETIDPVDPIPLSHELPGKHLDPSPNQETETLQNPEPVEIEEYDPFKVV